MRRRDTCPPERGDPPWLTSQGLQSIPEPRTPEEAAEAAREATEIAFGRLAELRDLTPPGADAEAVAELLDTFEEVVALSAGFTEALAAQDEERLAELFPQLEARTREAERLAETYGLEVCGQAEE